MSDKIGPIDAVFLAILPELYDGLGWHKKGTPTTDFNPDTNPDLKRALFNHHREQAGIFVNGVFQPGEGFYMVADDNNLPIGNAVGRVFTTPSNPELFAFFKEAIAGTDYDVCSLGALDNRNEFFIDAKGKLKSVAGREVAPYFGLTRLFGGQGSVIGAGHNRVMQCGNTTQYFRTEVADKGNGLVVKNTTRIMEKLPEFKLAIQTSQAIEIQFDAAMEQAAQVIVSKDDAREAFAGYVATDKLASKSIGRVNRLLQLFVNGKGNLGENAADWFNAVTDFFTHESAGNPNAQKRADDKQAALVKQWYASEHGKARDAKAKLASSLFTKGSFARDMFEGFKSQGKNLISKLTPDDKSKLD